MEISEYENIFENEEGHFFYQANHKIILALIKKYLKPSKKNYILDAGCGTGLLTKKLRRYGKVIGVDASREALKYAVKRKTKVRFASVDKLPFKSETFDLITCIDVLAHKWVKNDILALRELKRVLKPGGILTLRVSANKSLTLLYDKHVWTKKRYSKDELYQKIISVGFTVEKISYVNAILLPIAFIKSFFERKKIIKSNSAIGKLPTLLNKLMYLLISPEATLLKYAVIPFGIGLITLARKPILHASR